MKAVWSHWSKTSRSLGPQVVNIICQHSVWRKAVWSHWSKTSRSLGPQMKKTWKKHTNHCAMTPQVLVAEWCTDPVPSRNLQWRAQPLHRWPRLSTAPWCSGGRHRFARPAPRGPKTRPMHPHMPANVRKHGNPFWDQFLPLMLQPVLNTLKGRMDKRKHQTQHQVARAKNNSNVEVSFNTRFLYFLKS